jgi:predicted RNA-binding Zn ribbon-like protein
VSADVLAPLLGEPLPVELMNTVWADRDRVHDALADPAEALAWLRAAATRTELPAGDISAPTRAAEARTLIGDLRDLRDALRRLAADVTDDPRPDRRPVSRPAADRAAVVSRAAAVSTINRVAAVAPAWPELSWPADGPATRQVRTRSPATQALLSLIASQAVALFTAAGQPPLRACLAPGCVLFFVQHHPRREWCSSGCGNRARVARHYRRHHLSPGSATWAQPEGSRKQDFTTP